LALPIKTANEGGDEGWANWTGKLLWFWEEQRAMATVPLALQWLTFSLKKAQLFSLTPEPAKKLKQQ
jgi:hypothetical protein